MVGEGVAGAAIGAPCGHIVAEGLAVTCEMCGLACATAGALIGASILCLACYAGTKFGKLHPIGKGAVVVSSTGAGAFAGASVVEYAALGAGIAASTPAMLAGAAIGVVVVGGAVAVGHLAASADERNRLENEMQELRSNQDKMQGQLDAIIRSLEGRTSGS